jgi:hypothetical protein
LRVEHLEQRIVPAVYWVTGFADGLGAFTPSARPRADFDATTLRAAVITANVSVCVADTIQVPAGTHTRPSPGRRKTQPALATSASRTT